MLGCISGKDNNSLEDLHVQCFELPAETHWKETDQQPPTLQGKGSTWFSVIKRCTDTYLNKVYGIVTSTNPLSLFFGITYKGWDPVGHYLPKNVWNNNATRTGESWETLYSGPLEVLGRVW
jgi:hypothetical protein